MTTIRRATGLDVGSLLFVGALWGASFIFISIALPSFGPISIAAGRILLAAIVLVIVCVLFRFPISRNPQDWQKFLLVGIFNSAIPFFLISWGMQFISSAEAALLLATSSFSAMLLSHFFSTDERINLARGMGVAVGLSGVLVLVVTDLLEGGLGGLKGQFAVIVAGMSYALSSVMTRRISHLPTLSATAGITLSACIYMLPLAFLIESPNVFAASSPAIWSLTMLGVFSTALAFVIRYRIIRNNGAVFMAQVGYLVPVFGVFWGWLFLSEPLVMQTLISLGVILIGIAITRVGSSQVPTSATTIKINSAP